MEEDSRIACGVFRSEEFVRKLDVVDPEELGTEILERMKGPAKMPVCEAADLEVERAVMKLDKSGKWVR